MAEPRLIVSQKYVVVKVDGDTPSDAILDVTDGGETYAVVPAGTAKTASTPAMEDPQSGEVVIPTARLILRGELHSEAVQKALGDAGARLIRDYGAGGMVEAPDEAAAARLTEALQNLTDVKSAEQQILRPRVFRAR